MQGYDGESASCLAFDLRIVLAERLFFKARPTEKPNEIVPIRQPRRIDWLGLDQGKTVKYGQEQENTGFFCSVTTVLASGFVAEDTIAFAGPTVPL